MRIRSLRPGAAHAAVIGLALVWIGAPAMAELVNIDVEGDPPNDTTHSGADGVLSGAGTVWNGVESGVDVSDLLDEGGAATAVDVVFASTGGGATNPSSTNDLQDSGTVREFDLRGLEVTTEYDIAIYAFPFSFLGLTDSTGTNFLACNGAPTYSLPGTADLDYCLFENRLPVDLGGGDYGFTITPLDGVVAGVQLASAGGDPPKVPLLSLPGLATLMLGLVVVGAYGARSSRVRPQRGTTE